MKIMKILLTCLLCLDTFNVVPIFAEEQDQPEEVIVVEDSTQEETEMSEVEEVVEEVTPEITVLDEEVAPVETEVTDDEETLTEDNIEEVVEVEETINEQEKVLSEGYQEDEESFVNSYEVVESEIETIEENEQNDTLLNNSNNIIPGDSFSTAIPLSIGDSYDDETYRKVFSPSVGEDETKYYYFKFTINQNDVSKYGTFFHLSVKVIANTVTFGQYVSKTEIFKNELGEYAEYNNEPMVIHRVYANKEGIVCGKLNPGTYYIKMTIYGFSTQGFLSDVLINLTKNDDDAFDSVKDAEKIELNKRYIKEISGNNDYDVMYFNCPYNGKYKVTIKNKNVERRWSSEDISKKVEEVEILITSGKDKLWYDMEWENGSYGFYISQGIETYGITSELNKNDKYYISICRRNPVIGANNNEYGSYELLVEPYEISVDSIKLNKTSITLNLGKTETLKATVSPSVASNKKVTWTSSNTNVAKVDSNGKVTAVNGGTATITVATQDGKKTAKATITVNMPKVQAVAIYNSAHGADIRFKPISGVRYYGIWRKRTNPVTKVLEEKIVKIIDANTYTEKDGGNFKWIDPYLKDKYTDKGKEWEGGWVYYVTARSTSYTDPSYNDGKHLTIDGPISNKLNLYRLRNPELKTATANGNGKVTVTWSDVPTAFGYEVQYTLDSGKTWTKVPEVIAAYWGPDGREVKVPGYKPTVTISNLPKGKKVNFRIRCRKTNTNLGDTWSEYSPWRSTTVK